MTWRRPRSPEEVWNTSSNFRAGVLRPLRSTGVTRLPRYYGPLRHPMEPGLSLAGVRFELHVPRPMGLPVLRSTSSAYMPTPLPRRDRTGATAASSPSDDGLLRKLTDRLPHLSLSRPARRSLTFRPACSLGHPRRPVPSEASTDSSPPPPLRLLPAGATRRRVGLAPTGSRRLCTAHSFRGARRVRRRRRVQTPYQLRLLRRLTRISRPGYFPAVCDTPDSPSTSGCLSGAALS